MHLPVMEHFFTIQGEGRHAGRAAYFVRLGGCDVGCVWCDVKESWDALKHKRYSVKEIAEWVRQSGAKACVITGGEPLMHKLDELTNALQNLGIETWLETSGAYPISGTWNWICVSPKKFKAPLPEVLQKADELKVVVYNETDFKWAEQNAVHTKLDCVLFLQPEYSRFKKMIPIMVVYCKLNQKWNISIQIHKVMGVE